MSSPLLRRQARKNTLHGRKNEKRIARKLGAKLTIASGSTSRQKGDFRDDEFLYDAKCTGLTKGSIGVSEKMLRKLMIQAAMIGKKPCLTISFVSMDGSASNNGMVDWVMIPLDVFKEMTE